MTSPDFANAVELIKRIVADETADIREQIQHLSKVAADFNPIGIAEIGDVEEYKLAAAAEADHADELAQRIKAIKSLHQLQAAPMQWTRDPSGKMIEAPEGLWELSCSGCNYEAYWQEREGEQPEPCPTYKLALGT